jgi:hypothetical protein
MMGRLGKRGRRFLKPAAETHARFNSMGLPPEDAGCMLLNVPFVTERAVVTLRRPLPVTKAKANISDKYEL